MSLEVTRFIIVNHIELKQTTNIIRMINVNNDLKENQRSNYEGAVWTPNVQKGFYTVLRNIPVVPLLNDGSREHVYV